MAWYDWIPIVGPAIGGVIGQVTGTSAANMSRQGVHETNQTNRDIATEYNNTNAYIAEQTNATNLQLAREQNDWNVQQWNRQQAADLAQWNRENEYNSPVNQAQRLLEAGINPAMQGGVDNGNASGSPYSSPLESADLANQESYQLQPYRVENENAGLVDAVHKRHQEFMSALGMAKEAYQMSADIAESRARISKMMSDIDLGERGMNMEEGLFDIRKGNILADTDTKKQLNGVYYEDMLAKKWKRDNGMFNLEKRALNWDVNTKYQQSLNAREEGFRIKAATNLLEEQAKWLGPSARADVAHKMAQVGLFKSQAFYHDAMKELTEKDIKWFAANNSAKIDEAFWRARSAQTDTEVKQFEAWFEKTFGHKPNTPIWSSVTGLIGNSLDRIFNPAHNASFMPSLDYSSDANPSWTNYYPIPK